LIAKYFWQGLWPLSVLGNRSKNGSLQFISSPQTATNSAAEFSSPRLHLNTASSAIPATLAPEQKQPQQAPIPTLKKAPLIQPRPRRSLCSSMTPQEEGAWNNGHKQCFAALMTG
jgi:hypothetical protein